MARWLVNFEYTRVATLELELEDASHDALQAHLRSMDLESVDYYTSYVKIEEIEEIEDEADSEEKAEKYS